MLPAFYKNFAQPLIFGLLVVSWLPGCDFIDPRQTDPNPNLTEKKLLSAEETMSPWIQGLERQLAVVYNNITPETAIISDNYKNQGLFFNTNLDAPDIDGSYQSIELALFSIAKLRISARYGINKIAFADNNTTPDQLAECHFFLGWAYLLQGELFVKAPVEPAGVPLSQAINLDSALTHFNRALALTNQKQKSTGYQMALARTHYALGNKQKAVNASNAVLASEDDFIRFVKFNGGNGPQNLMQDGLYDRSNTHDLQPLPRLDFLDPKYHGLTSGFEVNIPLQKAEEAYLILTEAAIADQSLGTAKIYLDSLVNLVNRRPTHEITATDPRLGTGGFRPNADTVKVRASPSDNFRKGLILDRVQASLNNATKKVTIPYISGTSVNNDTIQAFSTPDQALELCYLLRQEIFIGEGRRMFDLGIRFPLPQTELLQNDHLKKGDDALIPFIPSFIPENSGMDAFSYDEAAARVTIHHNMNRKIVENKGAPAVAPFH